MAVVPAIILASIGGALIAVLLVNGFIWLTSGGLNKCHECRKRWGHKPCCTAGGTHDMQAVYVASLASGVPVITHNACRRCGYKAPLTGAGLQQECWKRIGIDALAGHDTRIGEGNGMACDFGRSLSAWAIPYRDGVAMFSWRCLKCRHEWDAPERRGPV